MYTYTNIAMIKTAVNVFSKELTTSDNQTTPQFLETTRFGKIYPLNDFDGDNYEYHWGQSKGKYLAIGGQESVFLSFVMKYKILFIPEIHHGTYRYDVMAVFKGIKIV